MTKKARLIIAAISAMLLCVPVVACADDENAHEHEYINYVYNSDATCGKAGTETAKCEKCNKTDTRRSEDHPATGEHSYVDYICENCFALSPDAPETDGLRYSEIRKDGETVGSGYGKGQCELGQVPQNTERVLRRACKEHRESCVRELR